MIDKRDPFELKVKQTILNERLLRAGRSLLVAVSGGPDSVALTVCLKRLESDLDLNVEAAHINHRLRGEEAAGDEEFVQILCSRWSVPLQVERIEPFNPVWPTPPKLPNLEEHVRRLRYRLLFKLALAGNKVVVTGHTLSDQAETMLMKLARGSGPLGLSGIFTLRRGGLDGESPNAVVIRPLLECSRDEILAYLSRLGESFREDRTNQDLAIDRNWVRHVLIPQIEARLNPRLIHTLARTAKLFGEIEKFLALEAKRVCRSRLSRESGDRILRLSNLRKLPSALQKQLVREVIRDLGGSLRDISQQQVQRVISLEHKTSGREVQLPRGIRAIKEFDVLRFTTQTVPGPFRYEMHVPGELEIGALGRRLSVRLLDNREASPGSLLMAKRNSILVVRNRRPGDRYTLQAGGRPKKIKELMRAAGIPKSRRDRLLCLEVGGELAWIEGFPLNPRFEPEPEEGCLEVTIVDETLPPERFLT